MRRLLTMVLLCFAAVAQAAGGLEIYFVRHAETLANATGVDTGGNNNVFSTRGNEQVTLLTDRLKAHHFDLILVSPAERAIGTILPYLQQTGQKGEIWPELDECCWQRERGNSTAGQLVTRSQIRLGGGQEAYFSFRDADSMHKYGNRTYADGVAQVRRAKELLKQYYFGSDKTLLIVAHYHSGQVLLADLLGMTRDELPNLENAKLTHLRLGEDGRFTLLSINDEKVTP